jgi:hypothetical protein
VAELGIDYVIIIFQECRMQEFGGMKVCTQISKKVCKARQYIPRLKFLMAAYYGWN